MARVPLLDEPSSSFCRYKPALFLSCHLDGEGCPPSVSRAEQQVTDIAKKIKEMDAPNEGYVNFGNI